MALYPVFTIRNQEGQYLGTYRAKNATVALAAFKRDQLTQASTFRKSMPMPNFSDIVALDESIEKD